jgi:hypothetical protein
MINALKPRMVKLDIAQLVMETLKKQLKRKKGMMRMPKTHSNLPEIFKTTPKNSTWSHNISVEACLAI